MELYGNLKKNDMYVMEIFYPKHDLSFFSSLLV